MTWYGGSSFERFALLDRSRGPYAWAFVTMIACTVLVPQLFWVRKVRTSPLCIFPISVCINVGMWLERYILVTGPLHRDFLPSSWRMYSPTYVEAGILLGSFGLFFTCFLLFCRFLPMIAISEVKGILTPSVTVQPLPAPAGFIPAER